VIGWIIVVLVVLVVIAIGYKVYSGGSVNETVPSRGHGYCPNMGVCDGCDICEED